MCIYTNELIPCEMIWIKVKNYYVYCIDYGYNWKEHYSILHSSKTFPNLTDNVFIWKARSLRVWYVLQIQGDIWFFSISGIRKLIVSYPPTVRYNHMLSSVQLNT